MQRIWCLENWLALRKEQVLAFVPDKPGVYVIRKSGNVIYVGRSDTSIKRRLGAHLSRFHGAEFTYIQLDHRVRRFRLEYQLISHFKKISKLENKISASIPAKL